MKPTRDGPALLAPVRDAAGHQTLELFRENDAYTGFIWQALQALIPRPVAGRVLEVGCGIGNLTRLILRSPQVTAVHAIDLDPAYVEMVRREIPDPRLVATASAAEAFCPEELRGENGFDCIVSSNVVEHIEDHEGVFRSFRALLRPEGVALILVPAHPWLYSSLDRTLSHFRRYRRRDLRELAASTGMTVLRLRHFNPLGAVGWWVNGKLLRRPALPAGQLKAYSRFAIPVSRLLDRLNPFPVGVSLIGAFAAAAGTSCPRSSVGLAAGLGCG